MHSLLQTATSDSLEAQPEGESVTVLPPTSDHSVKVSTPTLSVSHQRLTLFRQKTADNMAADDATSNDLPADGAPANELPTAGTALHDGLTAQHDSVEEELGQVSNMAHSTPMLAPPTPREVCRVYFAPILDETPVNTPTFFAAVESDVLHKRSGIIWSKASVRGGHWIVVPINKEEHIAHLKARQDIGGKYVAVSWIAQTIHQTIEWEGNIRPLTPLIITPLFSDTNPKQAAALIADRGNRPAWGPVTNAKRLNPAKAFQAKVWVTQKRNQTLRNAFLITPTTRITPVVPDEPDPTAVILYYNSVDMVSVISLIEAYARDLPEPAAVAQFYDHETEADLPKWLIASRPMRKSTGLEKNGSRRS
jgi:hypothetical protein